MNKIPEIKTTLPGLQSKKILDMCRRFEASALKTFKDGDPIVYGSAEGAMISDPDGNTFLDIAGSYAATVLGHRSKEVIQAVFDQVEKTWHVPSDFPTEVRAEFYELLLTIMPSDLTRVLVTVTGADACDAAVLLARSFRGTDDFIIFGGGYHGKGIVGLTIAGGGRNKKESVGTQLRPHFFPFPYCYRCPFDRSLTSCEFECLRFIERTLENPVSGSNNSCGILVEPVQGSGGSVPAPPGFMKGLRQLCNKMGILLIDDEIQTGFGRTGKIWAIEHDAVIPDLMVIGKGLGGGLPVYAVVGKEKIMMQWDPGTYSRTFLTNSILLASGIGALKALMGNRSELSAMEKGDYLIKLMKEELGELECIGDIRGKGLLLAVEFVVNRKSKQPARDFTRKLVNQLKYQGILTVTSGYYGNAIKIAPPIAIEKEQMDYFVKTLSVEVRKLENNL